MLQIKNTAVWTVAVCMMVMILPGAAAPETAKSLYLEADAAYHRLLKNSKAQKYRDRWQKCIKRFEKVYRHDPSGPWAAAGLYMSGKLYLDLYARSYKKSDQKEAVDIFKRVVKRYPKSRYRKRAQNQLNATKVTARKKSAEQPAKRKAKAPKKTAVKVSTKNATRTLNRAEKTYRSAEKCYTTLTASSKKKKYRDNWLRCIDHYESAFKQAPTGPKAAESLYMTGRLYEELHRLSYRKSDKLASMNRYDRVLNLFPESGVATKASAALGRPLPSKPAPAPLEESAPLAEKQKKPQRKKDAIASVIEKSAGRSQPAVPAGQEPGKLTTVQGLRFWSNPSYTRVVIDADRETPFSHRLLKKDPSLHKPQRLYIDLTGSRLGQGIPKTVPINDNLLSDARAGQYKAEKVRVVVDIKSYKTYKIFSLRNPFRIVIDVWGKTQKRKPKKTASPKIAVQNGKLTKGALAKQLALGVSRIVIDPGHGGKDFGAPGYLKGTHEKHIVLAIAKRLAKKIRKEIGCEVILTRTTDRYLTLEERTAIANTKDADLFISIHTNSARHRSAHGIETFFLNLATDDDAILVAARENATSKKNISDLQTILSDLMQNAKINESSRLAGMVQVSLHDHMKKRYSRIKNKGVKQAPFYVLLGAQMPAILVETSFISNPRECRRLTSAKYQDHLSQGILNGIRQYIRENSSSARFQIQGAGGSKG